MSKQSTLDKLSSFLDAKSPKLATFLQSNWKNQQQAVTYKELRQAIRNGEFDLKYLAQWQQDYSKFIVNHYAPLAQQAIETSAKNLLASHGGMFTDPMTGMMDMFIQTQGGKLIQQISTDQFNAINTLVRQAALSDTMSVDQLARAIRPCIGLTKYQSQTTYNYYNQLIADGYNPKQAQEMQAVYAAKLHRRRAATIAQTELAFAYNNGQRMAIQEAIDTGMILHGVTKQWLTAADENVCNECGKLDMEEVALDAPFSNGVQLPPAHPNCRCAIAYKNLQSAPQQPSQAAQPAQAPDPNADPDYQQPEIPDDLSLDPADFTYKGHQKMGTGQMWQYTDQNGDEWIFKPGETKYTHKPEEFRAYVQEAGYKVQSIVDPDSAVPVGTITIDTPDGVKFGSMQQRITGLDTSFDLKSWQQGYGGTAPSQEVLAQLQREHVTDYLLGNYDTHGGNFVLTTDGRLIGVDKEQAFRYIADPGAQGLSYTFHPNSAYGETEPIYNTIYRKFANGEIDLSLNDTLAYIKRVEAIPDAEYREIFRQYAESLHGAGPKAEQLLDQIVARKQGLRGTFETFYSELLTERKGMTTVFQFADSAAAATAAAAPLPATTFTSAALQGMSIKDLKSIAKTQGLKYVSYMTKDELVAAVSDPTQVQTVLASAKARATATTANRAAQRAAQAASGQVEGITQLSEAMKDFDKVLANASPRGVELISDSGALEGLQTTLRKVTVDGETYYELSGKLTHERWLQANVDMSSQSRNGSWQFNRVQGTIDYSQPVLELSGTNVKRMSSFSTQYIKNGDDIIVITGKDAEDYGRAMMGQFNIRVKAMNGRDAAQQMQQLLRQANITDIIDDVTPASLDRYKKMRVIWQTDPKMAHTLGSTATDAQINTALSNLGITQKRIDAMKLKKITDGYFTVIDPENVALASKYKVAYLYHEADGADAAVEVIKSGELLATTNRFGRGIFATGASSDTDIKTGGADSVFTRIVYEHDVANGEKRYNGFGDYVFVFDKKALERSDWFAYRYDEFGRTTESTFLSRLGTEEHFKNTSSSYSKSNELLFRKSLPLDTLTELRVPASERSALIGRLKREGITKVNGITLEKLIKAGGRYV